MPPIPYRVKRTNHPGSSKDEIENEPDWATAHPHRIGYRNRWDKTTGLIHGGDDSDQEDEDGDKEFLKRAHDEEEQLRQEVKDGKLVNFREAMEKQEVLPVTVALCIPTIIDMS